MIFQDPYSALNPRHTVGTIIGAPFRYQRITPPGGIRHRVQELLEQVGLSPEHYNRHPADFSGGQRQRICVARAIALSPKLIIADEPVSALDVSIQAQIINLLSDLRDQQGMAYLFIAHDLSVVRHICDRVAVMYLGKIVELADNELLYSAAAPPLHAGAAVGRPGPRPAGPQGARCSWPASRPARWTRRPAASSAPAAGRPRRSARPPSRRWPGTDPGHQVACHFPEDG